MGKFIKWFGVAALLLVFLLLVAGSYYYWKSNQLLNATYDVAPMGLDLTPADSTMLARGRHIAITHGCMDCHGPDLAGTPMMDAMPVAIIPASNLTPAGAVASYTDADWFRAIRNGIGPDGKSLWLMPSAAYTRLSPSDLVSLISFLKSADPVVRDFAPKRMGPLGRMLVASGTYKLAADLVDHDLPLRAAPPAGPTAAYGEYVVYYCRYCHGADLSGGLIQGPPGTPPSSNLTPSEDGLGDYAEEDFFRALREGRKPDGSQMEAVYMPWQATAAMTDVEIRAIWEYLQTIEPLATGVPES